MAGFAELLFGKDNPVAQFSRQNRNTLGAIGAGIASGPDFGQGLARAAQYLPEGRQADDAWATQQEEEAERQRQIEEAAALKTKYAEFFTQQGRPDIAQGIADGIVEPGAAYMDFIKPQGAAAQPSSVQEYEYAKAQGFTGTFMDFQTQRGGASERSLNPTYLRGPNGEIVMSQANKSGQLDLTQVPEGYSVVDPFEMAGGKTGAVVDEKTAAAARAALPGAEQMATITQKTIQEVRNNAAGMKEWFSQIGPRGAYIHPGSEMGKFYAAASPTNAQAFMQARDMLKGGGPITDYEGRRAEDAMSRMQAALDTGDQQAYLKAIADFEEAVAIGYQKLVQTAQGGYSAGTPGAAGGNLKTKYGLE